MSCADREAKLKDWVLGELLPDEAREMERHAQACGGCARAAAELRGVHAALTSHFSETTMPGKLVFMPHGAHTTAGATAHELGGWLGGSLWRGAALGAAAAVVFLGVTLSGLATWGERPSGGPPQQSTAISRAHVEAIVRAEVEKGLIRQREEFVAANQKLGEGLARDQRQNLAGLLQQVRVLESAQSAVWKETQQQGAMVEYVARNVLGGQPGAREK